MKEYFKAYLENSLNLDEICKKLNITSCEFLKALALFRKACFVELNEVDLSLAKFFPFSLLFKFQVIPFKLEKDTLYVACAKECSFELVEQLKSFFEADIKHVYADALKIAKVLNKIRIKEELGSLSTKLRSEWEENLSTKNQSCISLIFDFVLNEVLAFNASDIHIEARTNDALIRFRSDGVLRELCELEKDVYEALVFYIKFLANLNVAEQRNAQDGSFELEILDKRYDFRVSSLPLLNGESIVVRILRHDKKLLNLDELKFANTNLELLKQVLKMPHGMILLTGPTGSGKSTTLYACLNELKSIEKKIISAEDPIEYKMSLVQQILLNQKAGLEFNNVLRAILRQDPDIIMIGEIRDEESLDIALKASLTGHLILSTLHTNDCLSTITRLLDMKAKPYLIASSLSLIIAQRLLRKLCPYCKQKSKDEKFEGEFFKAVGCESCNYTGFLGRELVEECLLIDEELAKFIRENKPLEELLDLVNKKGFKNMFSQGLEKAKQGITSLDELYRVLK